MGVGPRAVKQAVIHHLQKVIDPETGVDVVRMRLIEDLIVDETGTAHYRFRPSSPLCGGLCYHAIAVVKQNVLVFPELCHGCGSCTLNCPEEAIHEVLNVTGVIEEKQAGDIRFAHGILNIGEAMAVPVIRQLKKQIGENTTDHIVILDASPGTACPVVETMRGADFVLMITEPTSFGLHDLRLAVEVARDELGLPVGVVINRDGVGDQGVEDYCTAENIPALMRIPLDRRIAEAYSEGVSMVEALPEYRAKFIQLNLQITDHIGNNTKEE